MFSIFLLFKKATTNVLFEIHIKKYLKFSPRHSLA